MTTPYIDTISFSCSSFMFLLFIIHVIMTANYNSYSTAAPPTMCHQDESSALLELKQSFSVDLSVSHKQFGYPTTNSWKLRTKEGGESVDCCSWVGVECDNHMGRVVGLDISSSFLKGPIHSNSSLFRLVHLQKLNLADNNFIYSQIPPEISRFPSLTSLNLSMSVFLGQIPSELMRLSKLSSLDLSYNYLNGKFPSGIFHLPDMHVLNVGYNPDLTGYLPEFNESNALEELELFFTNFSGKLPVSIGNLKSLRKLSLRSCYFSGSIPTSIGKLAQLTYLSLSDNNLSERKLSWLGNLTNLNHLALSNINLHGEIPSSRVPFLDLSDNYLSGSLPNSIGNLTELTSLSLSSNNFSAEGELSWLGKLTNLNELDLRNIFLYGKIPSSLSNLTQLTNLNLRSNHLGGEIPAWMMNLTQLTSLNLFDNQLHGPFLSSFSQLRNLRYLNLGNNNLSGTVDANIFLSLKQLSDLVLGSNSLSFVTQGRINSTLPQFKYLDLASCNLKEFPYFLHFQNQLEVLILSGNKIQGPIPQWLWNTSAETLGVLSLFGNFLTGFEESPVVLPGRSLGIIDISGNMLQGNVPVPPPKAFIYYLFGNRLSGEISPLMCQVTSLKLLDMSNNAMNGAIPQCLGNFSNSLISINLKRNNFSGIIPQTYSKQCNLKVMELSQNQLEGELPRSLGNCKMLQILDLADNQVEDTFPSWLGALPHLQVLVLRSNKFHGPVISPRTITAFPMLRIIDLSKNSFTGDLPFQNIHIWNAMKLQHVDSLTYMDSGVLFAKQGRIWDNHFLYSIAITNKGVKTQYVKILTIFTAVDLSDNNFTGEIPEFVASLQMLQLLSLSNNHLTGPIPSVLGKLTQLESLDLSGNKLSGVIPQQFAQQLHFLAFLNVSHNLLRGRIPQGGQFSTFENNSYLGNSALCGLPLSRKCGTLNSPNPALSVPDDDHDDDDFPSWIDWIVIFAGFGSGLVVGLVIGNILTNKHHHWFDKKFGAQKKQIAWLRNIRRN